MVASAEASLVLKALNLISETFSIISLAAEVFLLSEEEIEQAAVKKVVVVTY